MSCYISSNNERVYVALESSYGTVPAITAANRIPLVKLGARQVAEQTGRRDKTGSRTFPGLPNHLRKKTNFEIDTLMTEWTNQPSAPPQGPLFQAAMGGSPILFSGGTVASSSGTQVTFTAPHGLSAGQGVTFSGEMRFVAAIQDSTTVFLNAPFSTPPGAGSTFGTTMTYSLAESLGSASLFDYWDPSTAVQRIVDGAAMDRMTIKVNGDYQEFQFAGPARDVIDSASFESGDDGLSSYPAEPTVGGFDYTIVPGHLGEAWLGATETQFSTITAAELRLENNIELRAREFGSDFARCIAASTRKITLNFELFELDDAQTKGLYQAARSRSPIGVMLQLGEQTNQLFGAYMPAMVPEVPEYDDSETRLQWKFSNSRAQGTSGDELYVAFG
ncbi:MAG: hypothetical protein LAO79_13570 [Acidobacteriia bacterium]|nr:hypothetical protein [Terriglobia bacterium]